MCAPSGAYLTRVPEFMLKHVVALLAVAISTLTFRSSVMGQGPTVSTARSAVSKCAYEVCALRIEPAFFGSRKLVVGLDRRFSFRFMS